MAQRGRRAGGTGGRDAITRQKVIDTAIRLVERHGPEGLSMRKLSAELGVAPPTVYWHVGNRDELISQMIATTAASFGRIRPRGADPVERITSVCVALLREVRARPALMSLAAAHGGIEPVFVHTQEALAREIAAAGVHGEEAAFAFATVLFHLGGFFLLENVVPAEYHLVGIERWGEAADNLDPEMATRLRAGINVDEIFEYGMRAVVTALLADGAPAITAPGSGSSGRGRRAAAGRS